MAATPRPRRSVLYMPGANTRALEKARSLAADGLILDLEDAVAPDAKPAARSNIAAARLPLDAVLLPKVESADSVRQAEAVLAGAGAPAGLALWCMMETPLGLLHAEKIAAASPRVACLVLGTSDLTKDLHARHTRDRLPMLTALGLALLAGRAFRLAVLDGVHLDLGDDEGFAAACRQGREFGFDGKTLIHPKQIDAANVAFAPAAEEVEWSRRIIAAHEEAQRAGKGIVLVDGKLIENLHVEDAVRTVALADEIAAMAATR